MEEIKFRFKLEYSKQIKGIFDSLSRFISNNMEFFIFLNEEGLGILTNSKESIITNLITLSNNIVLSIDFNEKYYNNENGYFIKIEYKIFNIAHMILEIGQDIEFLVLNDEMIILNQNYKNERDIEITKKFKINLLQIQEHDNLTLPSQYIESNNFEIVLSIAKAEEFKGIFDKVFMTFKIEFLEFKFIFGDRKELIIENFDKNENISIGLKNCKFQKPGSGLNYNFKYSTKYLNSAMHFLNKDDEIIFKFDKKGNILLSSISKNPELQKDLSIETIIPCMID